MTLKESNNYTQIQSSPSHNKRVLSSSTGLAKFNITQRLNQNDQLNKQFAALETSVQENNENQKTIQKKKSGFNLSLQGSTVAYSPSTSNVKNTILEVSTSDEPSGLLKLASKQRELLEYKQQFLELKKKIQITEKEVDQLQNKFNPSYAPNFEKPTNPFNSPITKQENNLELSPSKLISRQSTNFNNLKKRLSIQQFQTKQSFTNNYNNITKDTNILISKGLSFVNNIKNEIKNELKDQYEESPLNLSSNSNTNQRVKYRRDTNSIDENSENDDDSDFDDSDAGLYHAADTSDYWLSVR